MQLFSLIGFSFCSYAQSNGPSNSKIDRLTTVSPNQITEKLYLQFDKPYYAINDTIWFKAYLLNNFLLPSTKSGVLNIDIANDSNKIVKQYRIPVQSGLAWGNIGIDEKTFTPGNYTLRAYTNWMRNFGDDAFYYKPFIITGIDEKQLLVNATFASVPGDILASRLQLRTPDNLPFAARPVIVKVLNNGKYLFNQKMTTGVDGVLDVKASLMPKVIKPVVVIENEKKEQQVVVPIILNRPENVDVQFLPEGGNLVAGLPALIGIKAVGEDGHGVDISGTISNKAGAKVASFRTTYNGMGSFNLDVKPGEKYTAAVRWPGGATREIALPEVSDAGTTLHLQNDQASDSLEVTLGSKSVTNTSGENYFLLGTSRGIVCYAAVVNLETGALLNRKIAKSLFPTGIAGFTLMTTGHQPVNERQVFIDHNDELDVQIAFNMPVYHLQDSVGLKLKVTDGSENPVRGNFSISVTDDTQVKTGGRNDENIMSRMLLTGDLKGFVETPGYYLAKTPEARQALDNLLLTQGWINFDWSDISSPSKLKFQPEYSFKVTGTVTNFMNKPVKASNIMLLSTKPTLLMDTVTDAEGRFTFDHIPRIDTPVFNLRVLNKDGKTFNVNIKPDETIVPLFKRPIELLTQPWYVNSDSTVLNYAKNSVVRQMQQEFAGSGHLLKVVNITAKQIIKGSQNLNGSGNADFVMDEKDLERDGKKTWLQLLQEKLKGFGEGGFNDMGSSLNALRERYLSAYVTDIQNSTEWYFVKGKPIKLIIDGISFTKSIIVNRIIVNDCFFQIRDYLMSHSAEDIKGIEVMNSTKYANYYFSRYEPSYFTGPLTSDASKDGVSIGPSDVAFVEITTRSGNGPGIDNTPGIYLFKPMPFSYPKQFYKPKYTAKDTTSRQDLRSTIDWEPNITTNTNGEANIWFYTADKPSTYTVTIEGTDMNGHFGYVQGKIKVEKRREKTK